MSQAEGQPFGKYQLLERIATGGMAEIYRARFEGAAGVTKPVVIKKILPLYAGNASFVSMFVNEAKISVGLSHGNIAQVFDFGEVEGEYFLAMEYVPGHPLSSVLRKSRALGFQTFPVPLALTLIIDVLKGLHYAHTRVDEEGQNLNIVHRDVSPQNVMIGYEGQVKLVDFGIAKARHATAPETQAGAVKGKYVYFAGLQRAAQRGQCAHQCRRQPGDDASGRGCLSRGPPEAGHLPAAGEPGRPGPLPGGGRSRRSTAGLPVSAG